MASSSKPTKSAEKYARKSKATPGNSRVQQAKRKSPQSTRSQQQVNRKPALEIQTTTLWDYPSQHYGADMQGDQNYRGATPSYIIWNLLQRYTNEGDLVVDPMCGSGTTIDVCRDTNRKSQCFDLVPSRPDITQSDARHLPLKSSTVDFVFVDPPYADHIDYSDHGRCIGKLSAIDGPYYEEMNKVIKELYRILKAGKYLGLYISDSFRKGKPFQPLGFRILAQLEELFEIQDIICVTRHNRTLKRNHWHTSAVEGNYFLRGFNYLFVVRKRETSPK